YTNRIGGSAGQGEQACDCEALVAKGQVTSMRRSPLIAPTVSAQSHGFRSGRGTHGVVMQAQQYVQAGYR
ncbi:MAG: hypothetical protein ACK4ZD_14885, partial [Caldimonas sp.]